MIYRFEVPSGSRDLLLQKSHSGLSNQEQDDLILTCALAASKRVRTKSYTWRASQMPRYYKETKRGSKKIQFANHPSGLCDPCLELCR